MSELPKYARLECERRWLVDAEAAAELLRTTSPWRIFDRYVMKGRLRVRRIDKPDRTTQFKLCKKYGPWSAGVEPIVNIYLSEDEYSLVACLPGDRLEKRRHHEIRRGAPNFAVDVFEGPLAGLILCEVEVDTPEAVAAIAPPAYARREVTGDPFFTGGNLARTSAATLRAKLGAG